MFCCPLLYVHSSIAIILVGKRELVALLGLSSWCPVVVMIVVFPDHTHILFYELLSPCLRFISSLYLDLYVLGDDAWIS